jgi:hypothetical protein
MGVALPRGERFKHDATPEDPEEIPMIREDNVSKSEHKDSTKSLSYKLYSNPIIAAANAAAALVALAPGAAAAPPAANVPKYSFLVHHIDGT